jgi:hypothetical protein
MSRAEDQFFPRAAWALVRTSKETHYVSATEPNRLMLFGETVAVYREDHTEDISTLCGQSFNVNLRGSYS